MSDLLTIPPRRRSDLLVRPLGERGDCVVKDQRSGEYYNLGPQESFLLERLDGEQTAHAICDSFQKKFSQPLTEADLQEFLELARSLGFLQIVGVPGTLRDRPITAPPQDEATSPVPQKKTRQNLLYFRVSAFDPDRFFNWLEPKIRFIWTRAFFFLSTATILLAGFIFFANRWDLVSHFLYFMPCFFCNVSDAWLIKEKSKRLWVTLAGAWCDLCVWAMAVLIWRLTIQNTLINYLAWVVLSVCGIRIFFNFNPLLKLDGYYLLSDWLSIPNLRQR